MGIVRTDDSRKIEIEEFRRMLVTCAALHGKKDEEESMGRRRLTAGAENDDALDKLVCVTSGVSFLGLAIVNQLLLRGYSVRIVVNNEEDIEKLREMELSGEMRGTNSRIGAVMAKLTDAESLTEAFSGCYGVFHTAAFIDPAGLSGYSKSMSEIEVKATETVTRACATAPSVRYCVLTSSLLACVWQNNSLGNVSRVINHDCWSDESVCIEKKLWLALGKLKAEKAAWRVAEETGLKLVTLCPGLIAGPEFFRRNSTSTIAYLKGAQEMYANGSLASADVDRVAEAHVCVFEAMNKTASGRYICFDQVIACEDDVAKLARETEMQINTIAENVYSNSPTRFTLSNSKLSRLVSRTLRCNDEF
ncbi:hypothetical protein RJ639_008490 [Escallonia herrerae]|uniref:3-beta hydroxysteroid dehydrogenase/isomerase domain-containing protein n=1 Tax=Escallonia herrerae TaxID=1293975 RepID=A0AA88VVB7_9ASTE|nr:hypothetical protein RJ639_008490 [Escallonia herrerae]